MLKLSKDLKYFFSGSLSLGFSSILSLITPILAVPFLIKTVGLSNYGISIIFFSIAMILSLIIDFGFNISGVNQLSKVDSKKNISKIIIAVILTKGVLFILLMLVISIGFFFIPYLKLNYELFFYSLLIPFSSILNLNWALQGLQKISALSIVVILSKVLYLIGLYLTINGPESYIYINAWFGIGMLVSGIISFFIVFKSYPLIKINYNKFVFINQINSSYHYFISNLSIYISSYLFPAAIGVFTSMEMVGVYSIVEKIYNLLRGIFPIYQTLMLPRLSSMVETSLEQAKKMIKQTYLFVILFMALEVLFVYIFMDKIVLYFTYDYIELTKKLVLISFIGLFTVIINCPLYLLILALDLKKEIMKVFLIGPIIAITSCVFFVYLNGIIGAIYALIIIELFYVIILYKIYKKKIYVKRIVSK